MRQVYLGCFIRILLLVGAAGCADSGATAPDPPRVASIVVTPGSATLTFLGETMAFTARVTDQYGAAFSGTVTWQSSASDVFTVNSGGVVRSLSNGSGTVSAELNGVSGTAAVTVNQKVVAVERVSGDNQRGLPGAPLAPVVVQVVDAGDTPVVGAGVAFSPTGGGGSVAPGAALSDVNGEARAVWTLGDTIGRQSLTASVAEGASAFFTATAQLPNDLADSVAIVSGDDQLARPETGLRHPIVVRVLDNRDEPIAGVTVTFHTAVGHGFADPDSVHSDAAGGAETTWTLGDKVGPQVLTASVPGGAKVQVMAIGSNGVCDRTPQVRDALIDAAGVSTCYEVTDDLLREIRELNLDSTSIATLDRHDFVGLSALESLGLGKNQLAELPPSIFAGLSRLKGLDLRFNQLEELPSGVLAELPDLEKLILRGNKLHLRPRAFSELSNLRELDLSLSQLAELPVGVFADLSALETLRLNNNRLVRLPARVFTGLSGLHELRLDDNQIVELPADVLSGLSSLRLLDLSENTLAELPVGMFTGLSGLHELDLYFNQLVELPADVFAGLSSLRRLNLLDNRLVELPLGVLNGTPALEHLALDGNQLRELPLGIFDGVLELEYLGLVRNQLRELPLGIFDELANLRQLYLWDNRLTTLPAGIFSSLPRLGSLELSDNRLTTLPAGIFNGLSDLRSLWLNGNRLAKLSGDVFAGLSRLTTLMVFDNQLMSLPDSLFSGLGELRWSWLHGNPGSPFPLELQTERTDTTDLSATVPATVVVRLAEGALFDMVIRLAAPGADLSRATVTINTGSTQSEIVTITRNTGTQGPVTVSLGTAPEVPDTACRGQELCYTGIVVTLGTAITLFR